MTPPSKARGKTAAKKHAKKAAAKKPARRVAPRAANPQAATAAKPDLLAVRAQIDGIDREIQALIAERALFAHQVGKAKGKLAAAVEYYRP